METLKFPPRTAGAWAAAVMLPAALVLWLAASGWARQAPAPGAAITDITLTKTVEVYSYEDLTFTIDTYSVRPGDNLANILKGRGLLPKEPDPAREAQIMRLVGELNPVIANLDQIATGQTLYLPSAAGVEQPPAPAAPDPGQDFAQVVTYELGQPDQSPARVVVRRQEVPEERLQPGEYALARDPRPAVRPPFQGADAAPAPSGDGADDGRTAPAAASRPAAQAASPPAAPGNDGPTGVAEDGTIYRTVTIRRGDTLERLLRREGLDRDLIYRHLIRLTVALNPGLRNPNLIVAGAELRIPIGGAGVPATAAARRTAPARGDQAAPASRTAQAAARSGRGTAPPAGERYSTPTRRLPAAAMPTADSVNARSAYGIIFTRLGEAMVAKGRLFLPLDEPPHFDIDTAKVPVLELNNGRKVVLDLASQLPADLVKRFTARYQEYQVFQPARREPFEKGLERLLAMCAYYRVYGKSQSFEGGRDVRLKLSADWLIWPNPDSWNRGQPTVLNLAPAADNGTPPAWLAFLADHGIQVIDLHQGRLVAGSGKSPTPVNNFTVIEVDNSPSSFAASLVRSLGYSPRFGVRVDAVRGRVVTGGAEASEGNPPVFWETESGRNILEYGDLSQEDLELLRRNGFNIISSGQDVQAILKVVLASEKIELGRDLVLNGDSSGGPSISLTITGQSFKFNGRSYLFTQVALPDNMTSLDPNQNVVVLRFRPMAASPAPQGQAPAPAPAGAVQPGATGTIVGASPAGGAIAVEDIN
jgi:hypothetical protein